MVLTTVTSQGFSPRFSDANRQLRMSWSVEFICHGAMGLWMAVSLQLILLHGGWLSLFRLQVPSVGDSVACWEGGIIGDLLRFFPSPPHKIMLPVVWESYGINIVDTASYAPSKSQLLMTG
jgi:hypothetical protein